MYFDGPAVVADRDRVRSVVAFEGPTRVDGAVIEDVIALGGDVDVAGQVGGDVVALNGAVRLEPTARVGGDVQSAGRTLVSEGAIVSGAIRPLEADGNRADAGILGWIASWLAMTFSSALLVLLLHWLVPPRVQEATWRTARTEPWPSVGVGAAVAIGLPFVAVIAMITIFGIPLGVGLLMAAGLLAFAGFVVGAFVLGRAMAERSPRVARWRPLAQVLAALAILCALTLIPGIGTVVWIAASLLGTGAAVLAAWRSRHPRHPRPEPVNEDVIPRAVEEHPAPT